MSKPSELSVTRPFWAEYEPGPAIPWDRRRVVHLHRRAGFAARYSEIERDLRDGPQTSIERLLAGEGDSADDANGFEKTADRIADAALASRDASRLRAWWVYRMLYSPDPLGERLTLMWHNHFATSNLKLNDLAIMRRQNDVLRSLARAPFADLLGAMLRDVALLRWLDADTNRKGHPNENLARELTELFTLGIGNYTEQDVKEAARALTGWTVVDGAFCDDPTRHDEGRKSILGHSGDWRGDDVKRMLLDHPATARLLAWRLCELLMGEGTVSDAGLAALADGLQRHDLDIGWGVATILRSEAFFAPANLGSRVQGPAEYVLGAVRAMELSDSPPSTNVLADWLARLGQDLFYPPNVGGWPSGRGWISPNAMIARTNFAAALVDGRLSLAARPLDLFRLPKEQGCDQTIEAATAFYGELLLGASPDAEWLDQLRGLPVSDPQQALRRAVALILASPASQLA